MKTNDKAEILEIISNLQTVPRRLFARLMEENAFMTIDGQKAKRTFSKEIVIGKTFLRFNKSTIKGLFRRVIPMVLNVVKRMNRFGRKQSMRGLQLAGLGTSTIEYKRFSKYRCDPATYIEPRVSRILWLVDGLIIVYIVWSEEQNRYYIHDYVFVFTEEPGVEYRLWEGALFNDLNIPY